MTDIIELSSDDDTSVPYKIAKTSQCMDSDTSVETDLSDIIKRYTHNNMQCKEDTKIINTKSAYSNDLSSSDDEDIYSLKEKLRGKYDFISNTNERTENMPNKSTEDIPRDIHYAEIMAGSSIPVCTNESEKELRKVSEKPKNDRSYGKSKSDKELKRIEKQKEQEQKRIEKQKERERLKAETEQQKAAKEALTSAYKNLKPEECMKFITVIIDSDLLSETCGGDILSSLQNADISYRVISQFHPLTVTWSRQQQAQLTDDDGNLGLSKNTEDCNTVLIIIMWNEFLNLVNEKKFCSHFDSKRSIFHGKDIFLGIYGLENYFRYRKNQRQQSEAKKASNAHKMYKDVPNVSRKDVDVALIEVQILLGCSHRMLETPQDVSAIIVQFTKSIAQIPYKLQKQSKEQQMNWFVSGDNKDCVKIDKSGNGLIRLWQQQLTQFALARLETAEAIASNYPSPSTLMQAYDECITKEEAEKLLQDIPIRRAAGPLTSVRKIGPELSKKMHILFTSTEGNVIL